VFPHELAAASVADKPDREVRSDAANPVVSRPGKLRTSQCGKTLHLNCSVTTNFGGKTRIHDRLILGGKQESMTDFGKSGHVRI